MSDDEKPKLGLRPQLGVKRTTEVGQVKQTFSHGRTHKVVVETKKARVFRKPGDPEPVAEVAEMPLAPEPAPVAVPVVAAAPATVADAKPAMPVAPPPPFRVMADEPAPKEPPKPRPEPVAEPEPVPAPPAPEAPPAEPEAPPVSEPAIEVPAPVEVVTPPAARPAPVAKPAAPEISAIAKALQNPKLTMRERQTLMLRMAEEERLQRAEEGRIRETREKAEAAEAEILRLEEKARAEAAEAIRAAAEAKRVAEAPPAPVAEEDDERPRGALGRIKVPGRPGEVPGKSTTRPRTEDRRRDGKLTITKALGDDDGRTRSLAAVRRARDKEKRAHGGGAGATSKTPREVQVPESITVQELANRMSERGSDLLKALFKMGMPSTMGEVIDQDTAELLVTEFGHIIRRVSDSDVEIGVDGATSDRVEDLTPRAPVVTIMGHVDHGKTSLLDALRGTDVVKGEAGGITQHIGAYQVTLKGGETITFLDTPGHEAFSEMRARGATVTDIVVLVVAGDDGLMPQTIEAINHVKAANVPMIVAINKMDKPGSNAQKIRTDLLQHDVQVEDMGGEVQDVEVSALKQTGLAELAEKILLQAEILELTANASREAQAAVVESRLDKGRGPLATVLVRNGTLRNGDIFVVGTEWGKVRALVNDKGQTVKEAGPSGAVEVLGLSGVPMAGDTLSVVETEARAREIADYRKQLALTARTTSAPASLESMFEALSDKKAVEFPVVIKADVHGSVEAIASAVNKLSTDDIKVRVLHSAVGAITESDVTLARASGALIIGFNVRANAKARDAAQQASVPLKYYDIIYDLIDEVKAGMAGKLGPEYFENVVGRAEIREVFQAGKFGKAAGCLVVEGFIKRNLKARVLREDVIVYTGSIASLRRFKEDVTQVEKGYECGIGLENFQDIKQGDVIETFEVEERLRTL